MSIGAPIITLDFADESGVGEGCGVGMQAGAILPIIGGATGACTKAVETNDIPPATTEIGGAGEKRSIIAPMMGASRKVFIAAVLSIVVVAIAPPTARSGAISIVNIAAENFILRGGVWPTLQSLVRIVPSCR